MISADPLEIERYVAACRSRARPFARRTFSLAGTLRLHRSAIGLDLLRAPLNVLLVGPALFVRLAAMLARSLGLLGLARWLATRRLFIETRLSRRIAELLLVDLFALDTGGPSSPPWAERIESLLAEYVAARHAVAELTAGCIALVVGLVALQAITPSAISLGPTLAREYAQAEAIASFWAGPGWGAVYYARWPAQATWPETIAATVAVMALFALATTLLGVVTDPLQQWLGLHEKRLQRLIGAVERVARGDEETRLELPDPYVARLADLADAVNIAFKLIR